MGEGGWGMSERGNYLDSVMMEESQYYSPPLSGGGLGGGLYFHFHFSPKIPIFDLCKPHW